MIFKENHFKRLSVVLLYGLFLCSCASNQVDVESDAYRELLLQDVQSITAYTNADEKIEEPLKITLEEAMRRSLAFNLDARIARMEILAQEDDITLERLAALPSVTASAAYVGRTNSGASSSRSVISGLQSLEPSQSTEENRRTASLEMDWNIIDAALAFSDAKIAREDSKIAHARYEKTIQDILRDVYVTYWRAYMWQHEKENLADLEKEARRILGNIEKAQVQKSLSVIEAGQKIEAIQDDMHALLSMREQLSVADAELKNLLSIDQGRTIILDQPEDLFAKNGKHLKTANLEMLQWQALMNRPEIKEEVLKRNISYKNIRTEIIKTFPGLSILVAGNYDSNSFLSDSSWGNYQASVMQNLTSLITAPSRVKNAKQEVVLSDAKRQALILAVLAQTKIAQSRLEIAEKQLATENSRNKIAGQRAFSASKHHSSGFTSAADVLNARLNKKRSDLNLALSRTALQEAYASMLTTLGRPVLPVYNAPPMKEEAP